MNDKIIDILEVLWLAKNEAKVYVSLLRLGSWIVWTVSRETAIPRATVYQLLDKLIERWLVMKIDRENILTYFPEDPEKIHQNLIREEEKIERKKIIFSSLLPELSKIKNTKKILPKITYFEWVSGYIELLEDSLDTDNKEILMITNTNYRKENIGDEVKLEELIRYERSGFLHSRLKKKITLKLLTNEYWISPWLLRKDEEELRETRIIQSWFWDIETMVISWNHVILVTDNHPIVWVHIQEEQLATMMKNMFNFVWQNSNWS